MCIHFPGIGAHTHDVMGVSGIQGRVPHTCYHPQLSLYACVSTCPPARLASQGALSPVPVSILLSVLMWKRTRDATGDEIWVQQVLQVAVMAVGTRTARPSVLKIPVSWTD